MYAVLHFRKSDNGYVYARLFRHEADAQALINKGSKCYFLKLEKQ